MVAALYRRYRPESFSEMIGQSQVTEPLMTALRNGRVGHAYLFSGPRGCGKTTSARILARCLNCAEGPTDTPCNVCPSCIELSRDGGGSLDVVEIDAASHGGVDDARDLRERAVFAPARDRFKIFIIDEAHMVTSAGFNALLKIVEEPPPHVKFVFATTEPEKVIGTIRSRTHHYPFRLIAPGTLIDYIQTLCESESVQVEPGVLPLVVRAGGGSVRDTLSILDQLIAGSEGPLVTADRAAGLLGFTGSELLDEVVTAFGAHDAAAAFRATDRVVQTGQDPRRFVEDLLERLRDLIVVSATTVDGAAAVFRGVPQDQLTRMFEQAQQFGSGELSKIADVTSETLDRMVGATAPRLQLELMIARALVSLDEYRAAVVAAPQPQTQQFQTQAQQSQARQTPVAQTQPRQAPAAPGTGQFVQQPAQAQVQHGLPAAAPAPAQDPISALAAARGAVTQSVQPPVASHAAAPQQTPPQQTPPQQAVQQQAPQRPAAEPQPGQDPASIQQAQTGTPNAAQTGTPNAAQTGTPNAAQTAASVRDFLRGNPAGGETSSQDAPAQPAHDGAQPHPNEGAAGFGRPISAVLSAVQIASIGAEPVAPAKPAAPAAATPATPQPLPAQPAPASAQQPPRAAEPGEARANPANPANPANTVTPPAQQPQGEAGVPVQPQSGTQSEQPEAEYEAEAEGGFSDLLEVWSDLLEEILEQDRTAWNAVKVVQPLSLEGDVLTVGIASRSDLDTFKAAGSGPLREAILSAVGISVRYVPRQMAQGDQATPKTDETAGPAPEEPHRAAQPGSPRDGAQPANGSDPELRAAARLSALGPALAAPAWADPVPEAPPASEQPSVQNTAQATGRLHDSDPGPAPAQVPAQAQSQVPPPQAQPADAPASGDPYANDPYAGEPSDDAYEDPYGSSNDYVAPSAPRVSAPQNSSPAVAGRGEPTQTQAARAQTTQPPIASAQAVPTPAATTQRPVDPEPQQSAPSTKPQLTPEPQTVPSPTAGPITPAQEASPKFVRYGEAVVRETLGARFVEELPLAPDSAQN